jgi:hypothetical protein
VRFGVLGAAVGFFALLFLLQLLSGILLFGLKFGVLPGEVLAYFAGDPERFIAPKTFYGLLKTAAVHLFAFGAAGFVVVHFLFFIREFGERFKTFAVTLLFTGGLLDIISPFLIPWSGSFVYLKLAGFLLFEGTMGLILLLLLHHLYKKRQVGAADHTAVV